MSPNLVLSDMIITAEYDTWHTIRYFMNDIMIQEDTNAKYGATLYTGDTSILIHENP